MAFNVNQRRISRLMNTIDPTPENLFKSCMISDSDHPSFDQEGRIVHVCAIRRKIAVAIVQSNGPVEIHDFNPTQISVLNR